MSDTRYVAGEKVEALDPSTNQWRRGVCMRYAPYRGSEGWYVDWTFEGPRESWQSQGGWQYLASMRKLEAAS
jgi:hypothetical protein